MRGWGWVLLAVMFLPTLAWGAENANKETMLRIAVFKADVTPPIGSPLCIGLVPNAKKIDDPLSARGLVLLIKPAPVVLCAIDWVGIANQGHDEWRAALAKAAGTTRPSAP